MYSKQNFASGNVLSAAQLNAMDNQIAANESALSGKQERITDLGTIRAGAADGSEAKAAITHLTPSESPTVGKVLKVKTVNADGTFVCEWADGGSATDVQINGTSITADGVANIPIASADAIGVAKYSNGSSGTFVGSGGVVYVQGCSEAHINNRQEYRRPIMPVTLNHAVKAALTDSNRDTTYTDAQKANACDTIGAERAKGDWVLKGTISGNADDRGNIDTGLTVDLSGCTELAIKSQSVGTGNAGLCSNYATLIAAFVRNGNLSRVSIFEDSAFGIAAKVNGYYAGLNSDLMCNDMGNARAYTAAQKKIGEINRIYLSSSSAVTSCNIQIYAR